VLRAGLRAARGPLRPGPYDRVGQGRDHLRMRARAFVPAPSQVQAGPGVAADSAGTRCPGLAHPERAEIRHHPDRVPAVGGGTAASRHHADRSPRQIPIGDRGTCRPIRAHGAVRTQASPSVQIKRRTFRTDGGTSSGKRRGPRWRWDRTRAGCGANGSAAAELPAGVCHGLHVSAHRPGNLQPGQGDRKPGLSRPGGCHGRRARSAGGWGNPEDGPADLGAP